MLIQARLFAAISITSLYLCSFDCLLGDDDCDLHLAHARSIALALVVVLDLDRALALQDLALVVDIT